MWGHVLTHGEHPALNSKAGWSSKPVRIEMTPMRVISPQVITVESVFIIVSELTSNDQGHVALFGGSRLSTDKSPIYHEDVQ